MKFLNKINLESVLSILNDKLSIWFEVAIKSIPNIIVALIVLFIFVLLAKLIRKISRHLIKRIIKNQTIINLFNSTLYFLILILGFFISLEILNLEKTVTSILAGAGVIGLALGFAFQEIASNFVSGILIAFRQPYRVGDIVEIDNFLGEVTNINLRTTSITTFQGLEVLLPNKYMFTKPFTNLTTTPLRRIDLSVGVSYGDDLEKVEEVTRNALENISQRAKSKDIEVYFENFGSSSINLIAMIWIQYPKNQSYFKAKHQAIKNIKKAYDQNDITIPFPIRTLDFGIKGGKELAQIIKIEE